MKTRDGKEKLHKSTDIRVTYILKDFSETDFFILRTLMEDKGMGPPMEDEAPFLRLKLGIAEKIHRGECSDVLTEKTINYLIGLDLRTLEYLSGYDAAFHNILRESGFSHKEVRSYLKKIKKEHKRVTKKYGHLRERVDVEWSLENKDRYVCVFDVLDEVRASLKEIPIVSPKKDMS